MNKRKDEKVGQNIYDFWESWTDITPVEQQAIEATKRARELIIKSVPKEALEAIYVKGSMLRREMKPKSDVDMVPIVTENKHERSVFHVNGPEISPVMAVPLSLEEFRANQLATKSDQSVDLRAKPDRFLRFISGYKLIYGKPINPNDFSIRTDLEAYRDEVDIIKNGYLPLFMAGEIDFEPLLKEIFWMTEMELTSKGVVVPHTFVGIAQGASSDHIIHEALALRQGGHLEKSTELKFINRLQAFLLQK